MTEQDIVSTHSRPKAAEGRNKMPAEIAVVSTHSRPKAAAPKKLHCDDLRKVLFQHTAARRRLGRPAPSAAKQNCFNTQPPEGGCMRPPVSYDTVGVSTHSRPKAAAPLTGSF